jgi:hypothetical protein
LTDYTHFLEGTCEGPNYICVSCHRCVFKSGVKKNLLLNELRTDLKDDLYNTMLHTSPDSDTVHLCLNCHDLIRQKKMPSNNVSNGLALDPIPPELEVLSIEEATIARNLIFEKLVRLPKTRMSGLIDRVINVPLTIDDVQQTVDMLPISMEDAAIIPLQFKIMKSLKNNHWVGFIRPAKCIAALKMLKTLRNPHWLDIVINEHYKQDLINNASSSNSDVSSTDDEVEEGLEQVEQDEEEYELKDAVKRNQTCVATRTTCFTSINPESELVTNYTPHPRHIKQGNTTFTIAPGEGKVPTNFLKEVDWDLKTFPSLFPTGRFGLSHQRKKKQTDQNYVVQRLLNKDPRCSKNTEWSFAHVAYIVRKQL